jgi:signal transduction histidine kinase
MAVESRKSGINIVGDMPWGTHFCVFYQTKQDLLDILLPYIKMGLESKEYCLWVIAQTLTEEEAKRALKEVVPDLDRYLADRSLEIASSREWYLAGGTFNPKRVTAGWFEKLDQALARDYAGMRVAGDEAWLDKRDWQRFSEYEEALDEALANHRLIVMCTYPLAPRGAAELLDVVHTHHFAVARRIGDWEVFEAPVLRKAKAEIKRLNEELEQRVIERTSQLAAAIENLNQEIVERKRAVVVSRRSLGALRELAARAQSVREEERAQIAREIHDELGQALTGLKMDVTWLARRLKRNGSQGSLLKKAEGMVGLIEEAIQRLRRIAAQLRPGVLDDLGLVAAVEWQIHEFQARTGIPCRVLASPLDIPLDQDRSTAMFRILQEALTNVARHAGATSVSVRLREKAGDLILEVKDSGRGITRGEISSPRSLGILGMRERALILGGEVRFRGAPGKGTTVTVRMPLGVTAAGGGRT